MNADGMERDIELEDTDTEQVAGGASGLKKEHRVDAGRRGSVKVGTSGASARAGGAKAGAKSKGKRQEAGAGVGDRQASWKSDLGGVTDPAQP